MSEDADTIARLRADVDRLTRENQAARAMALAVPIAGKPRVPLSARVKWILLHEWTACFINCLLILMMTSILWVEHRRLQVMEDPGTFAPFPDEQQVEQRRHQAELDYQRRMKAKRHHEESDEDDN